MKIAPRADAPPVQNEEEIVAALLEITGSAHCKVRVSVDPESGLDVHEAGYQVHAAGFAGTGGKPGPMYTFLNELGQVNQVPAHRVDQFLGIEPEPEPETEVAVERNRRRRKPDPADAS